MRRLSLRLLFKTTMLIEKTSKDVFCKYQLLKYKPWRCRTSNAWDDLDEDDSEIFCQKWNEYLLSD